MGYYTTLTYADFVIPETPEALQALKDLNQHDDLKNGGVYKNGEKASFWFSWMPIDYDQTVTSVAEVFKLVGFKVFVHEEQVHLIGYDGKAGQEELFLAAVTPFVKDGSYTQWLGEDGVNYRYQVINGKLVEMQGTVIWDVPNG